MSLQYTVYCRRFQQPAWLGNALCEARSGILLRAPAPDGMRYAEIAPMEYFGTESMASALACMAALLADGGPQLDQLAAQLADGRFRCCPATEFGLWSLCQPLAATVPQPVVRSAALLALDGAEAAALARLRHLGYRSFKFKLGRKDALLERRQFSELMQQAQPDDRFRLDPNRSWDAAAVRLWMPVLERFATRIEFVEEPLLPGDSAPAAVVKFYADWPVPVALDESLPAGPAMAEWLDCRWPGYWVIKPALLGLPERWLPQLCEQQRVVVSSAFETAITMEQLVLLAALWPYPDHGLGTHVAFADAFGCPHQGAVISTADDALRASIWNHFSAN